MDLWILTLPFHATVISCLRIDQNSGRQNAAKRFRTDPTIQVLLLHGYVHVVNICASVTQSVTNDAIVCRACSERENAGLNVTCAARVILVESVVNHAFELQAIARIDRMGQTRPTEGLPPASLPHNLLRSQTLNGSFHLYSLLLLRRRHRRT